MNFYQAGYFRQGVQGGNAGWGIVSPSKGMSRIAQDGFKGISANLVELKNRTAMPTVNYGIFQYDRFTYILHVNYAAKGEDARGVVFVHGYCFNNADYYELCTKPEMLFGIREENFLMEYDATQEQYPVKDMLSYDALSYHDLCQKYGFTKDEYREMVLRAINALEGYADPLCIKIDLPSDGYLQASKELVYLVMMGLPYHMRSKLSFFSYAGFRSTVYVCGHTEGNNCIDLDERAFECTDRSRLQQYNFTRMYNTLGPNEHETLEIIFKGIADAMNEMFQNPLQEVSCSQIEAGFQHLKKKEKIVLPDVEGICPETVLELLYSFLKCDLKESEEVYEYLGALLEVINDNSLRISNKRTVKQLSDGYYKTENTSYREEVCRMMAGELRLGNRAEGFAELNRLSVESNEQFRRICKELETIDKNYLYDYEMKEYLPFILTDIDKIGTYLREKNSRTDDYPYLLEILARVAKQEMQNADDFSQLYEIAMETNDLLTNYFPMDMERRVAPIIQEIQFIFWEQFNIAEFSPNDINKYERMEVEKAAEIGWNGEKSKNAGKIVKLIKLFQEQDELYDPRILHEILFTDAILVDVKQKERIQQFLRVKRTESFDTDDTESMFDCWLLLFYDFRSEQFSTIQWIKNFSSHNRNALEPSYINRAIKKSYLMMNDEFKKNFQESLGCDIKSAKRNNVDPFILKGLKRYERCVSGKKLKDDKKVDKAQKCFVDTLCRLPVGSLVLLAIGTLLNMTVDYNGYGVLDEITVLLTGIAFLVLFVVMTVVKAICMRGDFACLMEDAGITDSSDLAIYLLAAVFCLASVVAILLVNNFKIIIIAAIVYLIISIIGMVVAGILTRD